MSVAVASSGGRQATFDELGTPLRDVTFVVVDLETTGGCPEDAQITEIGAVKVRGGERLGEFQTLVNPGAAIPPFIQVLTGITDAMVASAPRLPGALTAFLEFARGAVLVAHNAPFDVGFLKAACERHGHDWPRFDVIDTARLARSVVTRDETPDCKLSSLARLFRAATTPRHRALDDARATVDVLHGLIERLGGLGVHSLEELATFSARVSPEQRRKRHLADDLPQAPGVYMFFDGQGRALYVGTSKDIRTRVRSYFTASEMRSRMAEMVGLAERVVPVVCATRLEAEVRELRLIAEHKPRYNRRSRFPERAWWLKLTVEAFPRLSVVRLVRDDGAAYLGPFGSSRLLERAMTALHEALPIRQCTQRLSPTRLTTACALAEMARCNAPCEGRESVEQYAVHVAAARAAMQHDIALVAEPLLRRIRRLAEGERYEDAAVHRDRLAAFTRTAARMQRLAGLSRCPQLVAARRSGNGGWELAVVRYGRLAAAAVTPPGASPRPYIDATVAAAETVTPGPGPTPAASAEETERILDWLEQPGTRLVDVAGEWSCPAAGAGRLRAWLTLAETVFAQLSSPHDRRELRSVHRPAR
jgi:DNA polymerase III subunit epsilon